MLHMVKEENIMKQKTKQTKRFCILLFSPGLNKFYSLWSWPIFPQFVEFLYKTTKFPSKHHNFPPSINISPESHFCITLSFPSPMIITELVCHNLFPVTYWTTVTSYASTNSHQNFITYRTVFWLISIFQSCFRCSGQKLLINNYWSLIEFRRPHKCSHISSCECKKVVTAFWLFYRRCSLCSHFCFLLFLSL